ITPANRTSAWRGLMIASRRSRKRSFLPEEGRLGRIPKTPEISYITDDFRQFPILQNRWESLNRRR
ncbi:hypothetical protein, partial [Sinorhizobium meliloti]|uniref:hypothetical protein n=1 Tax=Rhizobium meliloti TaxID=382 RepID=UPI001AEC46B5